MILPKSTGCSFMRKQSALATLFILSGFATACESKNLLQTSAIRHAHNSASLFQYSLEKNPDTVLHRLETFVSGWTTNRADFIADLGLRFDKLILELDGLAVAENVASGANILKKIAESHAQSVELAQQEQSEELKGLWLKWTERLLLTRSALQHFYSETKLNEFERFIDSGKLDEAFALMPELKQLLHPMHEARLVSIYRANSASPVLSAPLLDLIASSGGPLARLFLYQRFNAAPSLELAEAIGRTGLPRTTDLLGENGFLGNGPIFQATERQAGNKTLDSIRDFPERWKDMKNYLDSLKKIPDRLAKARSFWIEMHARMERSLSGLPLDKEKIDELKKKILQSFGSNAPAEKFRYVRDGIEFQEGDIVLIQLGETGGLWESFTGSGTLLSHMQMVTFDPLGLPYAIEMNYGRIMVSPLDLTADRYVVVRLRNTSDAMLKRIHNSFLKIQSMDLEYDFRFESINHQKLYCSELAAAILEDSETGVTPFAFSPKSERANELLKKTGVRSESFFSQGSYLGSSQFTLVAERIHGDPALLIKGQMLLDAFNAHLSESSGVLLRKHADSHTIYGLAALAQTLEPELRRGLGPQSFLFSVMVLDRLVHSIDNDVRNSPVYLNRSRSHLQSRITVLKDSISAALAQAIPDNLEAVFPKQNP
ncbi:MAG: hypothetical protein ACO3A4_02295 [Silvanigrellaceae bacterium]